MGFCAVFGGLGLTTTTATAEKPLRSSIFSRVRAADEAVIQVVSATEEFVARVVRSVVPVVRVVTGREGTDVLPVLPAVNVSPDGHGAVASLVAHF